MGNALKYVFKAVKWIGKNWWMIGPVISFTIDKGKEIIQKLKKKDNVKDKEVI